jgi:hypothetical protein
MRWSRACRFSTAAAGLAFSGRLVLDPLLLDNAPFIFFLPAILIACHFYGGGAALLVTGLGLALGDVFFQTPKGVPSVSLKAMRSAVIDPASMAAAS